MKKGIRRNLLYNIFYQLLMLIAPLVTTPYLARVMGAEAMGLYSYEYAYAYFFGMFILLGINNYGNREIAKISSNPAEIPKVFEEIYIMQICSGIIVLGGYVCYCVFFASDENLKWFFLIYILAQIVDINWLWNGLEKFDFIVIRNTVVKICSIVGVFVFVKSEKQLNIYTIIMLLSILLGNLLALIPAGKYFKSWRKEYLRNVKKHIRPNLMLFIPVIAISIYKYMDKIMLGILCEKKEVGYYEYSEKIIQIPNAVVNSLGIVMLPRMSSIVAEEKERQEKKVISFSFMFIMSVIPAICFGLMGIAKEFVPLFYGDGYGACVDIFYVLLSSCCFVAFANVLRTQYIIPHNLDAIYVKSVLFGAGINLILNLILISQWKAFGAAIATWFAEGVVCVYQAWKLCHMLNIKEYIQNATPFLLAGIVMSLILINIDGNIMPLALLSIKVILGLFIYLGLSLLFLMVLPNVRKNFRELCLTGMDRTRKKRKRM